MAPHVPPWSTASVPHDVQSVLAGPEHVAHVASHDMHRALAEKYSEAAQEVTQVPLAMVLPGGHAVQLAAPAPSHCAQE